MSIRGAARFFKIPSSTVHRIAKEGNFELVKMGPPHTLKTDQELALTQWVLQCEQLGHKVTKPELLRAVQVVCKLLKIDTPFTNGIPGSMWFRSFLKRNPILIKRMNKVKMQKEKDQEMLKILHMRQLIPAPELPEEELKRELSYFLKNFGNFEDSDVFKTLKAYVFWPEESGESSEKE
ncbi:Leucine-rich repeat [Sergentomyia squamirostris]